jgi:hypothetical protein
LCDGLRRLGDLEVARRLDRTASSTLTVTASNTAKVGNATLTITASSGTLTHRATVTLQIRRK